TVIIFKTFGEDTLWIVKKIYANEDVQIKSFEDSSAIYYYILNDIVDEARKMTDAFNLYENRNKFINSLYKLDKSMVNGNVKSSFDYLNKLYSSFWIGNYNATANGVKVLAGAEIFWNKNNELRIKIGESINKPFISIADTYGIIVNYPNTGDRFVIYKTNDKSFKDIDNKLILRKLKQLKQ
ncbi:MAG: hypothetical protein RL656_1349, partial [Bacteroidota bacterium]